MVTSQTASLLARILACSLALVALVSRDSSAKAPLKRRPRAAVGKALRPLCRRHRREIPDRRP